MLLYRNNSTKNKENMLIRDLLSIKKSGAKNILALFVSSEKSSLYIVSKGAEQSTIHYFYATPARTETSCVVVTSIVQMSNICSDIRLDTRNLSLLKKAFISDEELHAMIDYLNDSTSSPISQNKIISALLLIGIETDQLLPESKANTSSRCCIC